MTARELFCIADGARMELSDYGRNYLCPRCGMTMPAFPKPRSIKEEIDRLQNNLVDNATLANN